VDQAVTPRIAVLFRIASIAYQSTSAWVQVDRELLNSSWTRI